MMLLTLSVSILAAPELCQLEKRVVLRVAERVEKAYVLEAVAMKTARRLKELAATAAQSPCQSPDAFARFLTKTLREVSGDGHFYVETTKDASGDDWLTSWRASGRRNAFGVVSVQVLEDNIGYIRIKSFHELENAFSRYVAAFELVSETDALILDFRDNHGGSPQTTWPMQWTFLKPGSKAPLTIEARIEPPPPREEPPILWKRYGAERPLVILIDDETFSAPEAVAFSLQTAKRATVIGARSGGGAHLLDDGVRLQGGFTLYTPIHRPVNPVSRDNWEGRGITPDIETSSEAAIEAALRYLRSRNER